MSSCQLERIAVALDRPRSAAIIREKSYNDESGRQDYNCGSEGADNDDDKPTAGESHRASPTPAAKGPRKGRKVFLNPDRPWSEVESDEAQDEIMEKCDFLANEMAHHADVTPLTRCNHERSLDEATPSNVACMCMCAQVLVHAVDGARKCWCTQVVVYESAGARRCTQALEILSICNGPRLALIEYTIKSLHHTNSFNRL